MFGEQLLPLDQTHHTVFMPVSLPYWLSNYLMTLHVGNLCGTSTQPQASAQAAIKQWTAAKFPASKVQKQPY